MSGAVARVAWVAAWALVIVLAGCHPAVLVSSTGDKLAADGIARLRAALAG